MLKNKENGKTWNLLKASKVIINGFNLLTFSSGPHLGLGQSYLMLFFYLGWKANPLWVLVEKLQYIYDAHHFFLPFTHLTVKEERAPKGLFGALVIAPQTCVLLLFGRTNLLIHISCILVLNSCFKPGRFTIWSLKLNRIWPFFHSGSIGPGLVCYCLKKKIIFIFC